MAAKILTVACLQFALFNVLQAQVLNRIPGMFPGYGCGPSVLPIAETLLPNQFLLPSLPNQVLLPNYPSPIIDVPCGVETIVSNPVTMPATTIIQDSTVANNLANALQLLVVSNLLSNTLPTANDIIIPTYSPMEYGVMSPYVSSCGYNSYPYIF